MTCNNHHNTCDVCERRLCDRCARCYERIPSSMPGNFTHRCPSRYCRWIQTMKRIVRGYA